MCVALVLPRGLVGFPWIDVSARRWSRIADTCSDCASLLELHRSVGPTSCFLVLSTSCRRRPTRVAPSGRVVGRDYVARAAWLARGLLAAVPVDVPWCVHALV